MNSSPRTCVVGLIATILLVPPALHAQLPNQAVPPAMGQQGFGQQGFQQPGLNQQGFGQQGVNQPGFGQPRYQPGPSQPFAQPNPNLSPGNPLPGNGLDPRTVENQAPSGQLVIDVRVKGNETVTIDKVVSYLRTRRDRVFDAEIVQSDKHRLVSSGLFREVKIYTQQVRGGVVVTFELFERPTIRYVVFHGDRGISQSTLLRETSLEVGDALNVYTVQEARRKLEELYHTKGYPLAHVEIVEGTEPSDRGVVFNISEGSLQRISSVEFVGNTIASDARLKTQIKSKPGILWYFIRGRVDQSKIDEDVERLTSYYRSLGYFRARVNRELDFDEDRQWVDLRFVIDEGPRYVVRNVSVFGNERFDNGSLEEMLELKDGEFFNQEKMNRDLQALRDVYLGQGHIYADVQAEPRFVLERPGELDLVYSVEEGGQFRVGRINVHIAGEFPHTRESVVLNRLSVRPGDVADMREVRASERRLKASQLFENDPASGKAPRIEFRTPNLTDAHRLANERPKPRAVRAQSPDPPRQNGMRQSAFPLGNQR